LAFSNENFSSARLWISGGSDRYSFQKIRSGEMPHSVLERPNSTVTLVVQGAMDGLVETARRKIGLKVSVERLREIFVQPCVQFF
jgi:hypothetical protein